MPIKGKIHDGKPHKPGLGEAQLIRKTVAKTAKAVKITIQNHVRPFIK
jgi:hypothetical protein